MSAPAQRSTGDVLRRGGAGVAVLATLLLAACSRGPVQHGSVVLAGKARFEFLTPTLVRMEYAPHGHFVNAPSVVVQKRNWSAVSVTVEQSGGWMIASTGPLSVRYRMHSGPFTPKNLQVSWKSAGASVHRWVPGQHDPLNLGGLTYSLDNVSRQNLPPGKQDRGSPVNDIIPGIDVRLARAQPGLLSRAGYGLINDSGTPVWNAAHTWIHPRKSAHDQDWYLFAYGRHYRRALREYAELCGPVPMIPRYVLGPMVTDLNFEYFPGSPAVRNPAFARYGVQHIERELTRLRSAQIPLDTLVLDFGWHNYGWQGGYDWSPLIPHPRQFMGWLHQHGFKLALNDHPGYANTRESGLSYQDSHAAEVLRDLGRQMPPKPTFHVDLAGLWQFSAGPYTPGQHGRERWQPVRVGYTWRSQLLRSEHGTGWYRATVQLPAQLPPHLYLYLGGVSHAYELYVNGHRVSHHHEQWPRRTTYADITAAVEAGKANQIALRVTSAAHGGGLMFAPTVIQNVPPPPAIRFNLADHEQARVFMHDLHAPLLRRGVDFWWVDGGSGAARMPGLNPQLWTNEVYYDATQRETGRRAFILSRYGGWGSERYPGFFTGDTYSQWPVLAYEVAFSARGGNELIDYISHDIGGFHGAKIPFALYARWIEFGAFGPILRMHSAHENPFEGNLRMPWTYGARGVALMRRYFTLHTELIPYLYTYAWEAHRLAVPILRPLYLEGVHGAQAYHHPHEYFLGADLLVAPVLNASGERSVYLPPGQWIDFFTGKHYVGGKTYTAHYGVADTPVFVRAGAVIPEQQPSAYSNAKPLNPLVLQVYGSGVGRFDLYQDDGSSFDYRSGQYALTPIDYHTRSGRHRLVIGPTRGKYRGQLVTRGYVLSLHTRHRPTALTVDGTPVQTVSWDGAHRIARVQIPAQSIRQVVVVTWR